MPARAELCIRWGGAAVRRRAPPPRPPQLSVVSSAPMGLGAAAVGGGGAREKAPWTDAELKVVRDAVAARWPNAQIAKALPGRCARARACESGRPTRVAQVNFGDRTDCVEGAHAMPFQIRVATLRSMCLHDIVSVVCARAMSHTEACA